MPILEQIIPSPDISLHSMNEKELILSDFERKTVKGDDDKNMFYIEQTRKREEKTGRKHRQLNNFVNLSAMANLKHFDKDIFYKKKSSTKIYDRNTVHCPKCPFRTQSKLRLAPHLAGHERQDQNINLFKSKFSETQDLFALFVSLKMNRVVFCVDIVSSTKVMDLYVNGLQIM
jgi:hypothetical protein